MLLTCNDIYNIVTQVAKNENPGVKAVAPAKADQADLGNRPTRMCKSTYRNNDATDSKPLGQVTHRRQDLNPGRLLPVSRLELPANLRSVASATETGTFTVPPKQALKLALPANKPKVLSSFTVFKSLGSGLLKSPFTVL